jgi:hypothetical protein
MADNTNTVKTVIDVDTTPSMNNLRALKKQLKDTAAGSADFKALSAQIRDMEDSIASAKIGADDFAGSLEAAPGPVGQLFTGLKKVELATKSWGTALKATGIGLIVSLVGGLVAAFSKTEGSLKKLEPLLIGLEKIFGGIVEVFTPLLDAFLELALKALPFITTGIGKVYSAFAAFFTLIKEAGTGVGKIIKGIFTLDTDSITEGYEQIKGSLGKTVEAYEEGVARYEAGTKKQTKTEKENADARKDIADKALQERLKRLDAEDKLDAAKLEKLKAEALAVAETEQQKFDVEKKFAEKAYQLRLKDITDKQALYKKDSVEFKTLEADKIKLEADYITQVEGFATKQVELNTKKNKELLDEEVNALNLKKAKGEIQETEYQQALFNIKVKYAEDAKALTEAETAYETFKTEQRKKSAEDARQILALELQDEIAALDRRNELLNNDFAEDQNRLEQKKILLQQQRDNELAAAENDAVKRLEIIKKYGDAEIEVDKAITDSKAAEYEARTELGLAYTNAVGGFGRLLQEAAGENKSLAIAGILIEQAAGIASILINAKKNFVKDGGITSPLAIANAVAAAASVIAAGLAAKRGIQQINQTRIPGGGGGGGYGGGGAGISAPTAPTVPVTSLPQVTTDVGGQNPGTQLATTLASATGRPIRAFVVSQDIQNQTALDRRTNRAATFSSGN